MTRILRAFLFFLVAFSALAPAKANEAVFPPTLAAAFDSAKRTVVEDPQAARPILATAEQLSRQLKDGHLRLIALGTVRWLEAESLIRSNSAAEAGPVLVEGLRLIEPIRAPIKLRGDLLMSQGAFFAQQGQAAKALENYQAAFEVFRRAGEPRSQAVALQNIASLYSVANDNESAEKYYKQAASAYSGDPVLSVSLHNNRGNILMTMERYADAEREFTEALKHAKAANSASLEARVLGNLARNQIATGNLKGAGTSLDRGFMLTRGTGDSTMRRHLLASAAWLAASQKNLPEAKRLIDESFEGLDLENTGSALRSAHVYAYRIYSDLGALDLALVHGEAIRRLNEEGAKVATTTSAALMAAKFDYQGQQLQIERLAREQERKEAAFQRILFLIVGAATLLIIAALAWGILTLRRSRNKIAATNIELGETNVALEHALRAKTEFLATTSHEIRTPLNGILGMTQVMLSDAKLAAATRERISIVHSAGMTMRTLVDDILDVAKMETGNLAIDSAPVEMCHMLREETRLWREQAQAKNVGFQLDLTVDPCWVMSDAGRLRQIVFNLLSNAIKFTQQGQVSVQLRTAGDDEQRRLVLEVRDTGIGIPADKFAEIFESFRQVDASTTRKFGGTGLGLTICQNLARAMGGEVHVQSEEGVGSRFTVDLPLVPAEAPAVAPVVEGSEGIHVLILDRNPIARAMLKTLFAPRVASVTFAGSEEEFTTIVNNERVTHILIDEVTAKSVISDMVDLLQSLSMRENAVNIFVCWSNADDPVKRSISDLSIGKILEKPIAGQVLVDAVLSASDKNRYGGDTDKLATRAA